MRPSELFDLSGKVALVSGASGGLGRCFAVTLAQAGAHVVALGRARERLDETVEAIKAAGGRVRPVVIDIRNEADILGMLTELRQENLAPDILVNNAGTIERKPLLESATKDWRNVLETNLVSSFVLSREVLATMVERRWGRIVNVGSILALHGKRNAHAYVASKHGLAGLTRALAAEFGPMGITANAICPGYVRTDLTAPLQDNPDFDALVQARTPVGRWAETSDLVTSILFLCSPASSYVNGHLLVVDGGLTATH